MAVLSITAQGTKRKKANGAFRQVYTNRWLLQVLHIAFACAEAICIIFCVVCQAAMRGRLYTKEDSMYSYTMVQWLFFFYFYCLFGWCFESSYVSLKKRKLVNRGFMRGPFLPLYGSGAIMMLVVSMPFQHNILLTYIAGCIGATALEYVTGVVMEALFKVRYWDYSNQKFNFQGQICLSSTLAWGGLTILMTRVVHKPVEQLMLAIPGGTLTVV